MAFPSLKKPPQIVERMSIYPPTGTLEIKDATLKIPVIDLQYTSNTAKIEANSNVVTEFQRSKKLIKYPRVALTSGQSGLSGGYTQDGYTVEASSELTESGVLFAASNAFNSIQAYQSTDYAWSSGANRYGTDGLATNGTSKDTFQGIDGSWIGLTLPNAIRLDHIHMYNRAENTGHVIPAKSGIIWASNDGTLWYRILSFDNLQKTDGALNVLQVNSANFYTRYRVQITANNPDPVKTAVMIGELEFWGTPEYDPEAYGTDVVVKSVPNVPNTDWLEVYYDAKDLTTMPTTVDNKTGVSAYDATPSGGVGFDATQKAFTFNSSSNQYLSTSTPMSGNYIHSMSMWFKPTNLTAGSGDAIVFVGANGTNTKIEVFMESDRINYTFGSNNYQAYPNLQNGRWYHLTLTYNGQAGQNGREIYLDGKQLQGAHDGNSSVLALSTNNLDLGRYTPSGSSTAYAFDGSIANFRLFNRALTSDEIYQLYAYQKEYFGHGDLSMTLKAGRLGIGTSEPRAALDVNGGIAFTPNQAYDRDETVSVHTSTLQYEEGRWTPTFGAVSAPTYSEQVGYYTRIGNIVHLHFRITVSGLNNADGSGIHITIPLKLPNNNGQAASMGFSIDTTLFSEDLSTGGAHVGANHIIPTRGANNNAAIKYNVCNASGTILGFATYSLQVTA